MRLGCFLRLPRLSTSDAKRPMIASSGFSCLSKIVDHVSSFFNDNACKIGINSGIGECVLLGEGGGNNLGIVSCWMIFPTIFPGNFLKFLLFIREKFGYLSIN